MAGLNIGIDLGTTSVVIYVQKKGIVLSEASVAACDTDTGKILAIGNMVYDMIGRNPDSVTIIRPMKDGVVSDFSIVQSMLTYYIQKICGNKMFKPNIVICTPSSVTNLEKRTILELAISSGAARACLMEEPLAAAIGAGVDVSKPSGVMVVDIGGGTTDIAVLTMGSVAVSDSIKTAGNVLNEDIVNYVRRERNILIGENMAESIKKQVGCAYLREAEIAMNSRGKNYITQMPCNFEISSTEVYLAMREKLEIIGNAVRAVLEKTPPEMSADIADRGIYLTGGGALLEGMDELIYRKTGIKTKVAEDPVNCVANGLGETMRSFDKLRENGYFFRTGDDIQSYTREHEDLM
ncbi:MAG: rod shape-determining protein [Clostridiales bacterium]|nr:rod shape-determining protein [Clostridiales bacterium]